MISQRARGVPPYDSDDASLIRVTRRDWEKARRIPADLAARRTQTASEGDGGMGIGAGRQRLCCVPALARPAPRAEAASTSPASSRRRIPTQPPRRLRARNHDGRGRRVFARLKEELVPLIAAAADARRRARRRAVPRGWPASIGARRDDGIRLRHASFRLDTTVHPFCSSFGTSDIRVTTRYRRDDLESLFSCMHEIGHGLYERGVSPSLERTPLASGCSSGLHESQSRLWENMVGRSLPFCRWLHPQLVATFPEAFGGLTLERFHSRVNRVEPSFIRVDADEVTYGMHIILRFELEQELIAGKLSTADLPEAWNTRFEEYLGLTCRRTASACSRTSTGRAALRLLPDLSARQRDERADLGGGEGRAPRARRAVRTRATSRRSGRGSARTSTRSAAS